MTFCPNCHDKLTAFFRCPRVCFWNLFQHRSSLREIMRARDSADRSSHAGHDSLQKSRPKDVFRQRGYCHNNPGSHDPHAPAANPGNSPNHAVPEVAHGPASVEEDAHHRVVGEGTKDAHRSPSEERKEHSNTPETPTGSLLCEPHKFVPKDLVARLSPTQTRNRCTSTRSPQARAPTDDKKMSAKMKCRQKHVPATHHHVGGMSLRATTSSSTTFSHPTGRNQCLVALLLSGLTSVICYYFPSMHANVRLLHTASICTKLSSQSC